MDKNTSRVISFQFNFFNKQKQNIATSFLTVCRFHFLLMWILSRLNQQNRQIYIQFKYNSRINIYSSSRTLNLKGNNAPAVTISVEPSKFMHQQNHTPPTHEFQNHPMDTMVDYWMLYSCLFCHNEYSRPSISLGRCWKYLANNNQQITINSMTEKE